MDCLIGPENSQATNPVKSLGNLSVAYIIHKHLIVSDGHKIE